MAEPCLAKESHWLEELQRQLIETKGETQQAMNQTAERASKELEETLFGDDEMAIDSDTDL